MESLRFARTVCRGIGQWIDDLQLLDDRAGPSVRDDDWQGISMLRTHVNEMNVESVDLGDELRQRLQAALPVEEPDTCINDLLQEFDRRTLNLRTGF